MPKLKTNSSAKKRFKATAKGGFKHRSSFRNHILTKKTSKQKSRLAGMRMVNENDKDSVKRMLAGQG